jgi:TPR repeat protein
LGVPQDYAEAMRWFQKAADAGNSSAMNYADDEVVSAGCTRTACCTRAGACRRTTRRRCGGIGKPPTRAIARAMYNIGDLYYYGRGVPQDYAEAMRWYRQAADAGNSSAMNDIGWLYHERQGRAAGLRGGDAVVSEGRRRGQ